MGAARTQIDAWTTAIREMDAEACITIGDKWSNLMNTTIVVVVVDSRDIIVHQTLITIESDLSNDGWILAMGDCGS